MFTEVYVCTLVSIYLFSVTEPLKWNSGQIYDTEAHAKQSSLVLGDGPDFYQKGT